MYVVCCCTPLYHVIYVCVSIYIYIYMSQASLVPPSPPSKVSSPPLWPVVGAYMCTYMVGFKSGSRSGSGIHTCPAPGFPVPPPPMVWSPRPMLRGGGPSLPFLPLLLLLLLLLLRLLLGLLLLLLLMLLLLLTTAAAAAAATAAATITISIIYYYILCLFLLPLPLLLPFLNPTMYVHMYAPTTGHRGGRIPWRGG